MAAAWEGDHLAAIMRLSDDQRGLFTSAEEVPPAAVVEDTPPMTTLAFVTGTLGRCRFELPRSHRVSESGGGFPSWPGCGVHGPGLGVASQPLGLLRLGWSGLAGKSSSDLADVWLGGGVFSFHLVGLK